MFFPLYKADQASHRIWARAAIEEPDKAGEIMDYMTAKPQFQIWSDRFKEATLGKSLGNIRAMHNPQHLAGKVEEIVFNDKEKAIDVCLKVLDPVDWAKAEAGGYTGLSIGGGYLKKWKDGNLTRYTPRIAEISLVDAPCMPGARFLELQKSDGSTEEILLKGEPRTFAQLSEPPTFAQLSKFKLMFDPVPDFQAGAKLGAQAGVAMTGDNRTKRRLRQKLGLSNLPDDPSPTVVPRMMRGEPTGDMNKAILGRLAEAGLNAGRVANRGINRGIRRYSQTLGVLRHDRRRGNTNLFVRGHVHGFKLGAATGAAVGAGATQFANSLSSRRGRRAAKQEDIEDLRKAILGRLAEAGMEAIGGTARHIARRGLTRTLGAAYGRKALRAATSTGAVDAAEGSARRGSAVVRMWRQQNAERLGLKASGYDSLPEIQERARQARLATRSSAYRDGTAQGRQVANRIRMGAAAGALGAGAAYGLSGRRNQAQKLEDAGDLQKLRHSAAHPGFNAVANHIEHEEGVSREAAGAILASARRRASASAVHKNPRLKRIKIGKQEVELGEGLFKAADPAERTKVKQVMHEWKAGRLRSFRGTNPRTGKPRRGPVVRDQRQAIAIALNQARRMGKSDDAAILGAVAEQLEKRRIDGATLGHRMGRGASAGMAAATFAGRSPLRFPIGAAIGAAAGAAEHAVRAHQADKARKEAVLDTMATRARMPVGRPLSEKEHAERVAAAKKRWMAEGHQDIDPHFDALHRQAKRSLLGKARKMEAVAHDRREAWHRIADAQDAYDKVRANMPKSAHLMMYVDHPSPVNLYNPEGIGDRHFDEHGIPKGDLYGLHPHEADDWIENYGTKAKKAEKRVPRGLITRADQLLTESQARA